MFRFLDLGPPVEIVVEVDHNVCEHCECREGVRAESARTLYEWNGWGINPNRDVYLCRQCAEEHHAYWDDMWAEYYSGRL